MSAHRPQRSRRPDARRSHRGCDVDLDGRSDAGRTHDVGHIRRPCRPDVDTCDGDLRLRPAAEGRYHRPDERHLRGLRSGEHEAGHVVDHRIHVHGDCSPGCHVREGTDRRARRCGLPCSDCHEPHVQQHRAADHRPGDTHEVGQHHAHDCGSGAGTRRATPSPWPWRTMRLHHQAQPTVTRSSGCLVRRPMRHSR